MAYYLSQTNRSLVELIADRLSKNKNQEYKWKVNNPTKFENILRSACQLEEFKWIKDTYIISVTREEVRFKLRQLLFEEIESPAEEFEDQDFFSIINILLLDQKNKVNFVRPIFEGDELERLAIWATNNNYRIEYRDEILKVMKNES